jgi:hypothetical protein
LQFPVSMNGSKVSQGVFVWIFSDCFPEMEFGKFLMILLFPLVALNPSVYCK